MQVQKPDYQNSILNLVNSILHNYGAPHRYTTLPEADEILKRITDMWCFLCWTEWVSVSLRGFCRRKVSFAVIFKRNLQCISAYNGCRHNNTGEWTCTGGTRMAWVEHVFSGNPGQGQCISQYDRKWRSDRRRIAGL